MNPQIKVIVVSEQELNNTFEAKKEDYLIQRQDLVLKYEYFCIFYLVILWKLKRKWGALLLGRHRIQ